MPSPKSHVYVSASPSGSVPLAVNVTSSGAGPELGAAAPTTLGAALPAGSVTVSSTSAVADRPCASVTVTLAV